MTETTCAGTIQYPNDNRDGIVGPPLASVEITLRDCLDDDGSPSVLDSEGKPYMSSDYKHKGEHCENTVLMIPDDSPFPSQMKCSLCCLFWGLAEHQSFPVEFGAVLLGGQVVRDFISVAVAAKDDSKSPYVCLAVNIPRRSLLGAPAIHLNVDALWRNGRGQESGG